VNSAHSWCSGVRAGCLPDFRAVKHFSATDVPLPKLRFAIRFNSASPGAARQARVMQKRTVDSFLCSAIALLAFSILGFIYLLWQTYRMAAVQ
jgi:hypothetical protein